MWKLWNNGELKVLRENYPTEGAKKVSNLLPRHTIISIGARAYRLGIKMNGKDRSRIFRENLERTRRGKWSEEELKILREKYPTMKSKDVGDMIGRTAGTIKQKAHRMGIRKSSFGKTICRRRISDEDNKRLLDLYLNKNYSIRKLEKEFHKSSSTICTRLRLLGVPPRDDRCKSGLEGEEIATEFFGRVGWQILKRGNHNTPYDFLVKVNGEDYAGKFLPGMQYGQPMERSPLRHISPLESIMPPV